MLGVCILGGGHECQFFFKDKPQFDQWMEYLTEYCVQTELEKYYIKDKEVGKGNYAKVYLGKEIETEEVVAIKSVYKSTIRKSDRNVGAITAEIDAMRGLRHPCICALFGVFEDEEFVHLIMEYCLGGELFKRIIKRGKFTPFDTAKLV